MTATSYEVQNMAYLYYEIKGIYNEFPFLSFIFMIHLLWIEIVIHNLWILGQNNNITIIDN